MKITVDRIKTEAALLIIIDALATNPWDSAGMEITESNGTTWVNFGGFNGNPRDLWLAKKGTRGATKNTFIRCSLNSYRDVVLELNRWGVETSEHLQALAHSETLSNQQKAKKAESFIAEFSDVERAARWVSECANKNYRRRRTFWGNKSEKLGMPRAYGCMLRNRCEAIVK